jgi:hypothetical protein
MNKTHLNVIHVLILTAFLAGINGGLMAQEPVLKEYRNPAAGFQILYPPAWRVIEAAERTRPGSGWAVEILAEGELYKITFYEEGNTFWPGQYQVRVLANPEGLDLETAYEQFDRTDLWDRSEADTILAGLSAKTLVRWNYDSLGREYLLVLPERMFHILHDEKNSNDPEFAAHHRIFTHMTKGFRLLSAEKTD